MTGLARQVADHVRRRGEPSRARYPDREGFATSPDGVRAFYEVYDGRGGASTILLQPPWAVTPARSWKAQIPFLSRHFRVVTFDPRGSGRSDRPTEVASYLPEVRANDLLAVLEETATDRAVAVTVGPGTLSALTLAVEHPDRVSGLVLITPDLWPAERYLQHVAKGPLETYEGWDRFNPFYWKEDWAGFVEWWVAEVLLAEPHSTRQVEDGIVWHMDAGPEAYAASAFALAGVTREGALDLAGKVRCPVLIVYDDEGQLVEADTWTPLAEVTGGRLVKIEGANHAGSGRYPVPFNLTIREFARSLERMTVAEGSA